ncbi:MAG: hypothetical protein A2135_08470 [Actinobacteria bacterium RBG_16_67_15]|nr:MAG: hypothetical protein A2135_08470 [Actinobacteria bacterium RBG_16_67_15]
MAASDFQSSVTELIVPGGADGAFGDSVAVSGDTVVVGAPEQDSDTGGAYVFVGSGNQWLLQDELTAADGAADDRFGWSVAVWGDTVVVGAPGDDSNRGAAYVFTRSGGVWSLQAKLTAADGRGAEGNTPLGGGHAFGMSVGVWGDTVVVGASFADQTGAAYVFVRSGGVWSQQDKLIADDGGTFDAVGYSVGIWGDTVVVGAPGGGAAYVFTRSGVDWPQQDKLVAGGIGFGESVAVSMDTVVVGSPVDLDNSHTGVAYAFVRSGGVWSQQDELIADDGAADDFFGRSVGVSGDSGLGGAPGDDSDRGGAYVFFRSGEVWSQQEKVIADDGVAGDGFGDSVGMWGDTVAIGAPGLGAAYVFDLGPSPVTRYAGSNRYGTAAAIAVGDFPDPVPTVFVATGTNFPDALAGAAVAGKLGAPLLLVRPDSIPAETAAQLTRLAPDQIVILGGVGAVGAGVETELGGYASSVIRLAGANRHATAVAISQFGFPGTASQVIVATGSGFADALAGGPAAVALDAPVLLTDPDNLPQVVADEITRLDPTRIVVVGGTGAVSAAVFAQLEAIQANTVRISGANRYETAVAISQDAFDSGSSRVYVATGLNFPDGLAGAAAAGWWGAPILLVPGATVPGSVGAEITRLGTGQVFVLGGTAAVTNQVVATLGAVLGL